MGEEKEEVEIRAFYSVLEMPLKTTSAWPTRKWL